MSVSAEATRPAIADILGGKWSRLESLWVGECVLTPGVAALILERYRGKNRPVRDRQVTRLSQAIASGQFIQNGETLVFDNGGMLINGQHRCHACVESGGSVPVLVVVGAPRDAFDTFDQHTQRGADQVLGLHGEVNTTTLAGALGIVHCFERGAVVDRRGATTLCGRDIVGVLAAHPELRSSVAFVNMSGHRVLRELFSGMSLAAASHYILHKACAKRAADVFTKLATMSVPDDEKYAPILTLFRRLFNAREKSRGRRSAVYTGTTRVQVWSLTVRCWNHFCEGRGRATVRTSGDIPRVWGLRYDADGKPMLRAPQG